MSLLLPLCVCGGGGLVGVCVCMHMSENGCAL